MLTGSLLLACFFSVQTYQVNGLVLQVDIPHSAIEVSEAAIPGFMDAMVMTYPVEDGKALNALHRGDQVHFTLTVKPERSYISHIESRPFDSAERDPVQVKTLKLMESAMSANAAPAHALVIGDPVPDFTLTDQQRRPASLSEFKGKVVALTFIYTRCPLPDYCLRLSNNLGRLQHRFQKLLGRDLVLLSITFDPLRDRPEVLAQYAAIWKADARSWRFLTGPLPETKTICGWFGMNFWPDEGLLTHSLHTVVIDRQGRLAANLEGNHFTAEQLGDLVGKIMSAAP